MHVFLLKEILDQRGGGLQLGWWVKIGLVGGLDVHINGDCKLKGRLVIWELRFYQKQIITVLYIIHLNGGRNITFFSHDNFSSYRVFCGMAIYGMFVLYSLMQRWFALSRSFGGWYQWTGIPFCITGVRYPEISYNQICLVAFFSERGQWAVYYTSPQSFMITFSYSLVQQLWGLW